MRLHPQEKPKPRLFISKNAVWKFNLSNLIFNEVKNYPYNDKSKSFVNLFVALKLLNQKFYAKEQSTSFFLLSFFNTELYITARSMFFKLAVSIFCTNSLRFDLAYIHSIYIYVVYQQEKPYSIQMNTFI